VAAFFSNDYGKSLPKNKTTWISTIEPRYITATTKQTILSFFLSLTLSDYLQRNPQANQQTNIMSTGPERVNGNDIIAGVIASTINNSSNNQNMAIDLASASSMPSTQGTTTTLSSISDPDVQVLEVSTNPSNKPKWDEHNAYVVNTAKLDDVKLMEMEDGKYKQQPCGRRASELTTIDGFTINGVVANIKTIKVDALKLFCSKNNIFKPNTGEKLWKNVSKLDLCDAIIHKITKLAANEDPYPHLVTSTSGNNNNNNKKPNAKNQEKVVVNRFRLANVVFHDNILPIILGGLSKTLTRKELDNSEKTDQKIFTKVADEYNNFDNEDYNQNGTADEISIPPMYDPADVRDKIDWQMARATFKACNDNCDRGLNNWRRSGVGETLEQTTLSTLLAHKGDGHKPISDFIRSIDMLYWYHMMLPHGNDLFAKFTAYEEPLEGKGKTMQSLKRKATSAKIDTQKELAAAHMMMAKAEHDKVNLALKKEAKEDYKEAKEDYKTAKKERKECFNEAVNTRFDGDRKEAKECYNRFKVMKQANGGITPATPSSNDTNWSMCCELNELDNEIVYSKKQLDEHRQRDRNNKGM
jgi:hypothetical protein